MPTLLCQSDTFTVPVVLQTMLAKLPLFPKHSDQAPGRELLDLNFALADQDS